MEVLSRVREEWEARVASDVPDLAIAERLCREGRAGTVEAGLVSEAVSLLIALEHMSLVNGAGIRVDESEGPGHEVGHPSATAEALGTIG